MLSRFDKNLPVLPDREYVLLFRSWHVVIDDRTACGRTMENLTGAARVERSPDPKCFLCDRLVRLKGIAV